MLVLGVLAVTLIGCQRKAPPPPPPPPPTVPVAQPIVNREVKDFSEYTGRTDALQSVTVRAQVTGELKGMPFKEGSDVRGPVKVFGLTVREGDVLFRVNPAAYKAAVAQADGQLKLYQSQKWQAEKNYALDKEGAASGAVSPFQIVQDKANIDQAEARIESAQATLQQAQVNLDYCTIRAPISGRISRYYYTPGNVAIANQTMLTTIVSMEKMYAYFDVEEGAYDRIKNSSSTSGAAVNVRMEIEGERNYPHTGKLDFINNQVNPSTGTIALRAIFDNEHNNSGLWTLIPGRFARIRLELGEPYRPTLIVDKAIGSDQGLKFVYVLDAENKVQARPVETGPLQEDGLRVIKPYKEKTATEKESGVKPGEWVVVGGLPQLRAKMEIKPEKLSSMPLGSSGGEKKRSAGK
jgi:multidrug efflux system membrane fusion protein